MRETRKELLETINKMSQAEEDLASTESDLVDSEESLIKLEEKSSAILQREIRALSVLKSLPEDSEVALSNPNFA